MFRLTALASMLVSMALPCSGEPAGGWTCKPIWSFSGMGDKAYDGHGRGEAAAKDLAREKCVAENRGLELDDFCVANPKGGDWHCAQEAPGVTGALGKN